MSHMTKQTVWLTERVTAERVTKTNAASKNKFVEWEERGRILARNKRWKRAASAHPILSGPTYKNTDNRLQLSTAESDRNVFLVKTNTALWKTVEVGKWKKVLCIT